MGGGFLAISCCFPYCFMVIFFLGGGQGCDGERSSPSPLPPLEKTVGLGYYTTKFQLFKGYILGGSTTAKIHYKRNGLYL